MQLQIDNFCDTVGSMRAGELPPSLDLEVPEQWKGIEGLHAQVMSEWTSIKMEDRIQKVLTWLESVEKLDLRITALSQLDGTRDRAAFADRQHPGMTREQLMH